jgi:superfamily II DNA helicase RecQ
LIVSPTSSGKTTLLFTLVAGEPGKVTVVVVSTIALQQEIVANGKKLAEGGVSVYDWKEDLAGGKDSWDCVDGLVVVQAETALGDAFQAFLDRVHILGKLQRVVIDEVHLLLYWGETFRARLTCLFKLKRSGLPFLCLTGTLPPSQEEYLAKRLEVAFPITYRFTATIKNMRYTHEHLGSRSLDDADLLNHHVDQLSGEYLRLDLATGEGQAQDLQPLLRGLIFCFAVADAKRVHGYLQSNSTVRAYLYHAPQGNSKEEHAADSSRMDAELANFCDPDHGEPGTRENTQWLVATSAAGVGINLPKVQAVLIWGATHSLVDLVQMSGRAGRDHRLLPAATRIVTNDYYVGMVHRDRKKLEADIQAMGNTRERLGRQHILADKQALLALLEPQQRGRCLRSQLQAFLHSDDEADVCPTDEEQLWCGVCRDLTGTSDSSSIRTQEEEAAAASARCAAAFSLAPLQHPAAPASSSTSSFSDVVPTLPFLAPAAATSPSQHDNEEWDNDPGMDIEVDEEGPQSPLPISAVPLAGRNGGDGRALMLEDGGGGPLQQDGPARAEGPRALVDPGGKGGGSEALQPSCEASSFWSDDDDDMNDALLDLVIPSASSPTPCTSSSLSSGAPAGPSSSLDEHLPSSPSLSSPSAPPTSTSSSGANAAISLSTASGAHAASSASFPSGPRAVSSAFPLQAPAVISSSSSSSSGACSASSTASSSASHIALSSSSSSSSSNSVPQLDFHARNNAMAAATVVFARVAMSGITDGTDGKKITACGLCLVKTGTPWGGKQPHDGGCQNAGSGLCPLLRNVCFHCLEKYHFKGEDCKLKKVRQTAQNEKVHNWCCACLTKDDRRSLVTALHANGFGFKCALGKGNTVFRACMALYEFKIETVNTIMGGKQKYRECFMKSNRILAESMGSLGKVKPNKESYVKWLHGAWMNGGNLSNAAVLFAGYFHYYKESDVLTQDEGVWETLMSVPE